MENKKSKKNICTKCKHLQHCENIGNKTKKKHCWWFSPLHPIEEKWEGDAGCYED